VARIFWDTNLFIYLVEGPDARSERLRAMRRSMRDRGDELLTSTLTLGELLVRPKSAGDEEMAGRYASLLQAAATLLPFDSRTAMEFAGIRARRNVKVPDAIQLACAARAGVDLFVTNDERLSRLVVPGIQFIVPLDRAFI